MAASGTAPARAPRPSRRPGQLPGGPHGLSRAQVADNQRRRIVTAMTELIGEQGYWVTTISQVIERAGVSRRTFYDLYESREECFLELHDALGARLLEAVLAGSAGGRTHRERADAAIDALVAFCVEHPAVVRTCMVESLTAGAQARRRRMELLDQLAEALTPPSTGLRNDTARPTLVARATIGALLELSAHTPDRSQGREPARLAKAFVAAGAE